MRRRHAEAQERQRRLGEDDRAEADGGEDDDRRRHVGQDVAHDDARVAAAHGPRGLDVRVLAWRRGGPPDHPRVGGRDDARPARAPRCPSPGPSTAMTESTMIKYGNDSQASTTRCTTQVVGPAEVAAGHAEGGGEHDGQRDGEKAHGDRHAGAVDDPAPHVAAQVVGAEPVGGARRLHARAADRLVVAVRRDPLGEHRHHQHGHHDDPAQRPQRLAPREPPQRGQPRPAAEPTPALERGRRLHHLVRTLSSRAQRGHRSSAGFARAIRSLVPVPRWGASGGAARSPELIADPRVEDRIEGVDRQVDEHHGGDDHAGSHPGSPGSPAG